MHLEDNWKELKVAYILDPMNVFNNVPYTLQKHISYTKKDANFMRRLLSDACQARRCLSDAYDYSLKKKLTL